MKNGVDALVVSNNLKSARIKKGYLQEDVAKLLGVSRQTVCNYEANPNNLTLEKFIKLSQIYDCELDYFFGV